MSKLIVKESADKKQRLVIKNANMSEEFQEEAVSAAAQAMTFFNGEENLVAAFIKKQFDSAHHPLWHCIVGEDFGSSVTAELGCFVLFYLQMPDVNTKGYVSVSIYPYY